MYVFGFLVVGYFVVCVLGDVAPLGRFCVVYCELWGPGGCLSFIVCVGNWKFFGSRFTLNWIVYFLCSFAV